MNAIALLLQMPFKPQPPHPNHAPVAVFIVVGAVVALVAAALYLATGIGGERDRRYGDPERQYHLFYRSYGPFGGFKDS